MRSVLLSPRVLGGVAVFATVGFGLSAETKDGGHTVRGRVERMGAGTVQSFLRTDKTGTPVALGVTLSNGALDRLPPKPNTVSRCYDLNGDGTHTGHECIGDLERILDVPVDSAS